MTRGRLICPFVARFERFNIVATPQDPVFRNPTVVADGTQSGASSRLDTPLEFPVQVSNFDEFMRLRDRISGDDPISQLRLVAHFKNLEERGLVRSDGTLDLVPQDRLVELRSRSGIIELRPPDPPGRAPQGAPRGLRRPLGGRAAPRRGLPAGPPNPGPVAAVKAR